MQIGEIVILTILIFSVVTRNKMVAIATSTLLLLHLLSLKQILLYIDKNGVNIGVIFLTAGFMVPFLLSRYSLAQLKSTFFSLQGLIGITAGVLVAILGGKGISLNDGYPSALLGVVVGTFIGVSVFKGVPVGPMIGTGMAITMIRLIDFIKQ